MNDSLGYHVRVMEIELVLDGRGVLLIGIEMKALYGFESEFGLYIRR